MIKKRILVGISAGIAAYKCAELVRRLVDNGCEVRVVMTKGAKQFVTPTTLQALTGHAVRSELFDSEAERAMSHIELARWPQAILMAPATANVIARLAHGLSDDLLTTLCLATKAPITIAPAMNHVMWANPTTQDNCQRLAQRGVTFIGPDAGFQACGEQGEGRMSEVDTLVKAMLGAKDPFVAGKRVLITAGPTREAIDPVRYISNHSSGKMGYALAHAAHAMGAEVVLVSGPTQLPCPLGVTRIDVETASQMHRQVMAQLANTQVFIATAAVADYTVAESAHHKLKKTNQPLTLELIENPDILADVANSKQCDLVVGFAAETENVLANARHKRLKKQCDVMIANQVGGGDRGFSSDYNAVTLITADNEETIELSDKSTIAVKIMKGIAEELSKTNKRGQREYTI